MDDRAESCYLGLLWRWPAERDSCVFSGPEEVKTKIGMSSLGDSYVKGP